MQSPTILLAEDDPVIALDLMTQLERFPFQVVAYDNPDDIPASCFTQLPALIILNFHYRNGSNGLELARNYLAQGVKSILCVTGAGQKEVESSSWSDDRLHILYKPFSRTQLHSSLERLCQSCL